MNPIRVIPALDIKDGRVVTGISFVNLRDAGDPVECARSYCEAGADELCLLDINATHEGRGTMLGVVRQVAGVIDVPLTVSGGVRSVEDFDALFKAGAAKVSVNSAAIRRPELISEAAAKFGSQCVVCAIDAKKTGDNRWEVYLNGGRVPTGMDAVAWAVEAARRGAGELLPTSMDRDGQETGYDLELIAAIRERAGVPVVASGGAGQLPHFYDAVAVGKADAVLAASLFHFGELSIAQVKAYLCEKGLPVR